MKVAGEAVLNAPIDAVWAALNDPEVLRRTIPGCERLDPVGPDAYSMTVSAGVGSIKGSYAGEVALTEQELPSSFLLTASGAGAPGTVSTQVRVALAALDNGNTKLTYDADAVVGGMIAGVGQRMLAAVAKKLAGQFFAAVDKDISGFRATADPVGARADGTATVGSAPGSVSFAASAAATNDFARGAIVGAAIALAGVIAGAWAGRIMGRRR